MPCGLLSTVAAGFDATLDVNAIRFTGVRSYPGIGTGARCVAIQNRHGV